MVSRICQICFSQKIHDEDSEFICRNCKVKVQNDIIPYVKERDGLSSPPSEANDQIIHLTFCDIT